MPILSCVQSALAKVKSSFLDCNTMVCKDWQRNNKDLQQDGEAITLRKYSC